MLGRVNQEALRLLRRVRDIRVALPSFGAIDDFAASLPEGRRNVGQFFEGYEYLFDFTAIKQGWYVLKTSAAIRRCDEACITSIQTANDLIERSLCLYRILVLVLCDEIRMQLRR